MSWAGEPWVQGIGWALLHSLWQGALIVLTVRVLAVAAGESPHRRHRLAGVGLALLLTAAVGTAVRETRRAADDALPPPTAHATESAARGDGGVRNGTMTDAARAMEDGRAGAAGAAPALARLRRVLDGALPLLVAGWACGVLLLSLRLGRAWRETRRLRTLGTGPLPAQWEARVRRLAERMRVSRPVRALRSAAADVPMVIGALHPVLLVPASLLTGMPAAQLEFLLAHELAHVRRHDYLLNLLQSVADVLLFYHPAAWWLSGALRETREQCCDDEAVRTLGSPREYVQALVALERARCAPRLAAAASGGSLLRRAERLLRPGRARATTPASTLGALLGMAAVAGGLVLLHGSAAMPAPDPSPREEIRAIPPVAAAALAGRSGVPGPRVEVMEGTIPAPASPPRGSAAPGQQPAADGVEWLTFAAHPGACGTPGLLVLRAADRNVAVRGSRMDVGYSRRAADNWNAVPDCAAGVLRVRLERADGRVRSLTATVADAGAAPAPIGAGDAAAYLLSLAASSPEAVALPAVTAAALAASPASPDGLLALARDAGRPDAVRALAVRWLGHLADASAAPELERLAAGAGESVRQAALEALAALKEGAGAPALLRLRDHPDAGVRESADRQWRLLQARLPAPDP